MLEAAVKNKLRLKKYSLIEDEITSTIFSPLAYMKPIEAWEIIKIIAIDANISKNNIPSVIPTSFGIDFWPKHMNIEPDIACHFQFTDNTSCNILIEIKHGALLNPPCELVRQWVTRPDPNKNWLHIYIVPSAAQGIQDMNDSINILRNGCDPKECMNCSDESPRYTTTSQPAKESEEWKECLGSIDWMHIQEIAKRLSMSVKTSCTGRWGEGVHKFLEKHGYIPFIGFNWLKKDKYMILDMKCENILFAKAEWFSFLSDSKYAIFDQTVKNILFKK